LGRDDDRDLTTRRRRSGQVTRQLRLLRAHGVIKKVSGTHRYLLSEKGRTLITLLAAAKDADTTQLVKNAA
jgi:DNA-binding HxlR family transcriptional regulator